VEAVVVKQIGAAKELSWACGFTQVGELDVDTIRVRTEVRDTCAQNKCKAYGNNWSCPPGCGTLAECEKRIRQYRQGLILQTTGKLEDSMDYEGMEQAARDHAQHLEALEKKIRDLYPGCLIIGAGACKRCESCTYPDAPCRFPKTMTSSMEAFGMIVSDVCKDNGLSYYYGPNTLTYVGCVLLF
jgi:predicted metal-binding protein